jgi:hypothetical protein
MGHTPHKFEEPLNLLQMSATMTASSNAAASANRKLAPHNGASFPVAEPDTHRFATSEHRLGHECGERHPLAIRGGHTQDATRSGCDTHPSGNAVPRRGFASGWSPKCWLRGCAVNAKVNSPSPALLALLALGPLMVVGLIVGSTVQASS